MKTIVCAEIGQNFESLQDIKDSIKYVSELGAIPKLQAWFIDETVCKERSQSLYNAMKKKELPREWYLEIHRSGLFYSVFSPNVIDFLEDEVSPWAYKIASPDCVNRPLIERALKTNKPLFLSVGGTTDDELRTCVEGLRRGKVLPDVTLMHCMVEYPAAVANLGNLKNYMNQYPQYNWGYSDHTANPLVPALAVAMGATAVECHFKIRPNMKTPDNPHSLDKESFRKMVENVREAEKNLALVSRPTPDESKNLIIGRRGIDGKRPLL